MKIHIEEETVELKPGMVVLDAECLYPFVVSEASNFQVNIINMKSGERKTVQRFELVIPVSVTIEEPVRKKSWMFKDIQLGQWFRRSNKKWLKVGDSEAWDGSDLRHCFDCDLPVEPLDDIKVNIRVKR